MDLTAGFKKLSLKSGKYVYDITYKKTSGLPNLNLKKRRIFPKVRTTQRNYFDHHDNIIKEINYPKDLWYTLVLENDPVEIYLQDITELYPNWVKIDIKNNN